MEAEGERDDLQDALSSKDEENTNLNKQLQSKKVLNFFVQHVWGNKPKPLINLQ